MSSYSTGYTSIHCKIISLFNSLHYLRKHKKSPIFPSYPFTLKELQVKKRGTENQQHHDELILLLPPDEAVFYIKKAYPLGKLYSTWRRYSFNISPHSTFINSEVFDLEPIPLECIFRQPLAY
jgi:hypothetical protein